jgi:hypothetical protein
MYHIQEVNENFTLFRETLTMYTWASTVSSKTFPCFWSLASCIRSILSCLFELLQYLVILAPCTRIHLICQGALLPCIMKLTMSIDTIYRATFYNVYGNVYTTCRKAVSDAIIDIILIKWLTYGTWCICLSDMSDLGIYTTFTILRYVIYNVYVFKAIKARIKDIIVDIFNYLIP